jgi:signal transduction histidine kinase
VGWFYPGPDSADRNMKTESSSHETSPGQLAEPTMRDCDREFRRLLSKHSGGAFTGDQVALIKDLEAELARRTRALRLIQDVAMEANKARTVRQAIGGALRGICEFHGWQLGHAFWLPDERGGECVSSGVWHECDWKEPSQDDLANFRLASAVLPGSSSETLIGRVIELDQPLAIANLAEFADPRCSHALALGLNAAFAIPVSACGETAVVLEFFPTVSIEPDDGFLDIVPSLSIELGHAIERNRLETAIADATVAQQRELGRELHDSVSQVLTGVGMMAETLRLLLSRESSPHAEQAARLVSYLNYAQQKVRQVSRGLMPVEPDAHGLMHALERLAQQCRDVYDVRCRFECKEPVFLADYGTQLYYIAREAAHNAAKHAQATAIAIRLCADEGGFRLTIEDNGDGTGVGLRSTAGTSLSLMRHRARVIGASLEFSPNKMGGTTVSCTLPRAV